MKRFTNKLTFIIFARQEKNRLNNFHVDLKVNSYLI